MMELIAADSIDIGILRPVADLSTKFQAENVFTDRLLAALPAGNPLARRPVLRLADLAEEPFVVFAVSRSPTTLHQKTLIACREAGFTPRIALEGGLHVETIVGLVAGGLGVALLPSVAATVQHPDVVFKKLTDRTDYLNVDLMAAHRKGRITPAMQAFLSIARTVGKDIERQARRLETTKTRPRSKRRAR